ncbi:MAG: hypothetical protein HOM30_04725 [Gammaproteobacteria bacterium]|jgi:beta-ribofuranosylaminobenzene 5'-phosphate synthase|nr:hypothetical protein [Gammaproteobacteria bacterium]MBT4462707.1 hypothetical protein [Gammaproteobacteria bacterium]MBT4654417.1 hypothetical protein [Gammaproteobacteria bacterium]MBT5117183.1 hypothetical protein [Gammaproteobacteria bacterium]
MNKNRKEFEISSPSRLHLGFYGFDDNYGYKYGSMGLAINAYKTTLCIKKSKSFCSNIPKKFTTPVLKYLKKNKLSTNFEINLLAKPPSHIGLGSGSQLSLCMGKSIFAYLDIDASINDIANIFDRGERSGTGISLFSKGGFVVDACKKFNELPMAMFNSKFPSKWKIILINDNSLKGAFGKKEVKFFNQNIKLSKQYKSELSHIVLRGILPSVIYKDFDNFSKNISEFQKITSLFYKDKQKGVFLSQDISEIMKYIRNYDNLGMGQSSWGPMSYIFVESSLHAKELISIIQNKFNVYNNLTFKITSPWNSGYKISYK